MGHTLTGCGVAVGHTLTGCCVAVGHMLTGCGVAVGHTLTGCCVAVGHMLTGCGVAVGHTLTGCDEDTVIIRILRDATCHNLLVIYPPTVRINNNDWYGITAWNKSGFD